MSASVADAYWDRIASINERGRCSTVLGIIWRYRMFSSLIFFLARMRKIKSERNEKNSNVRCKCKESSKAFSRNG